MTAMTITLSYRLPSFIPRPQGVEHIELSPEDTLAALKAKICNAMGLPPALVPALALINPQPLVPVGIDDSHSASSSA